MKMRPLASILVIAVVSSVTLAFSAIISSATDETPRAFNNRSIEELLKPGWQIAGYSTKRSITAQRSFSFAIQIGQP